MTTTTPVMTTECELIDGDAAARLLGMSARHFARLVKDRAAPQPRRLGKRLVRWSRSELVGWIEAGCPTCG